MSEPTHTACTTCGTQVPITADYEKQLAKMTERARAKAKPYCVGCWLDLLLQRAKDPDPEVSGPAQKAFNDFAMKNSCKIPWWA